MKSRRVVNGYVLVYKPDHPKAMKSGNWCGYIYEHILVAENSLKRKIKSSEEVHHLDLNRANNNPENLIVLEKSQHTKLHNWISKGDLVLKNAGENGVNSKKPKSRDNTRICACPGCNNVVTDPRNKCCSRECGLTVRFSEANIDGLRSSKAPLKKDLEEDIKTIANYSAIGRKYGVSDNAVRKWARKYGIIK